MSTLANEGIENQLRKLLPPHLHSVIPDLASTLLASVNGTISTKTANETLQSNPFFGAALLELAGRTITSNNSVISFGQDTQVGDVSIGQAVGRDIINTTTTLQISAPLMNQIINNTVQLSSYPEKITRFSQRIDSFANQAVWVGTGTLTLMGVAIVLMLLAYFLKVPYSSTIFFTGATLNTIALVIFVYLQIQGPLRIIRLLRENQKLLDTVQDISIKLIDTTSKFQSFLFKHLDRVNTILDSALPLVKEIPGFHNIEALQELPWETYVL